MIRGQTSHVKLSRWLCPSHCHIRKGTFLKKALLICPSSAAVEGLLSGLILLCLPAKVALSKQDVPKQWNAFLAADGCTNRRIGTMMIFLSLCLFFKLPQSVRQYGCLDISCRGNLPFLQGLCIRKSFDYF